MLCITFSMSRLVQQIARHGIDRWRARESERESERERERERERDDVPLCVSHTTSIHCTATSHQFHRPRARLLGPAYPGAGGCWRNLSQGFLLQDSSGTCPSYRKCISNDLNIRMISKVFGTPAQNNFEHVKKESQIMSLTILTVSYGELSRNVEGKIARASIAGGHYAADASWLGRCSALLCPSVSPKCSNDGVDSFWDKMLCFNSVAQSNLDTSANGTRKLIWRRSAIELLLCPARCCFGMV